jgi:hypothetical protein
VAGDDFWVMELLLLLLAGFIDFDERSIVCLD